MCLSYASSCVYVGILLIICGRNRTSAQPLRRRKATIMCKCVCHTRHLVFLRYAISGQQGCSAEFLFLQWTVSVGTLYGKQKFIFIHVILCFCDVQLVANKSPVHRVSDRMLVQNKVFIHVILCFCGNAIDYLWPEQFLHCQMSHQRHPSPLLLMLLLLTYILVYIYT